MYSINTEFICLGTRGSESVCPNFERFEKYTIVIKSTCFKSWHSQRASEWAAIISQRSVDSMLLCKARNFGHFRLFDSDACIHDAPAFWCNWKLFPFSGNGLSSKWTNLKPALYHPIYTKLLRLYIKLFARKWIFICPILQRLIISSISNFTAISCTPRSSLNFQLHSYILHTKIFPQFPTAQLYPGHQDLPITKFWLTCMMSAWLARVRLWTMLLLGLEAD